MRLCSAVRPDWRALASTFVVLGSLLTSPLLGQQPDSDAQVQALYTQAKTAEASGDSATAIAKYEAILRIAPKLGSAYNNLGLLYFRRRDYQHAVDVLKEGL